MGTTIKLVSEINENNNSIFLVDDETILSDFGFNEKEVTYINNKIQDGTFLITINRLSHVLWIEKVNTSTIEYKEAERLRNESALIWKSFTTENNSSVCIFDLVGSKNLITAFIEGFLYSSYQFTKYKTQNINNTKLTSIEVVSSVLTQPQLDELNILSDAITLTRDLVNETPTYLSAQQLAKEATLCGEKFGFSVTVLNKPEIENLKMGGLLAVNRGSVNPPTFSILEWKPENATNQQPIVLVGKGIVYDTGGINLKTMPGSLDDMKCDMGGAATVIGAISAISANKLPIYVIGLIPSTDNRPGFNAYVPGDVITMYSGQTVEVMNTDAEGRLILADALHYAKQYNPKLTIDLATLTGSAVMAIGSYGIVAMGNTDDAICKEFEASGYQSGEKIAWFPFWEEYDELIKSEIADMKNIGGREAGAITAGKFLSKFVDYNWIHLDIAGPAFLNKPLGYKGVGATGAGVRLLYTYLKYLCQ
ncbi:MAG: leucyl aminopeptidase [Marinilabiliaceae bacterium]|nr:leucyl aminopeptidase [Marinilabiliaceae bacterium]